MSVVNKEKLIVKIKYTDYYANFDYEKDIIWKFLKNSQKYEPIISDKPDFLIYSVFGDEHLKYDCVKIFYTGEQQVPDFNMCDYAIGFDYLAFGDRYFRLPIYYLYMKDYFLMKEKHLLKNNKKEEFCSFVYSNAFADPIREKLFETLSKYKKVNSGGKYKNNVGGVVESKLDFERRHKFSLAIENVSYSGYTTEKLIQSFAAGCIPIYWGDPLITKEFNEKAFINVRAFKNLDEVVERVKMIDNNDKYYYEMIQTPALVNEKSYEDTMSALDSFLDNIFAQSYSIAYRRTRKYWNQKYVNKEKAKVKSYNLITKIKRFPQSLFKR